MHKLRLRHNFRCALYGTPMAYRIMGGVFNPFLWLLMGDVDFPTHCKIFSAHLTYEFVKIGIF